MLGEMRRRATNHGFGDLVAPVRPNRKSFYPLMSIDRYAAWMRTDGLPYDPWLRVHARAGARIAKVCRESMIIPGTLSEWEEWTGLQFPESGLYVVAGALEPIDSEVPADRGTYVESNVWMHHRM